MRTSSVFAIFCLAVGIAPSFALPAGDSTHQASIQTQVDVGDKIDEVRVFIQGYRKCLRECNNYPIRGLELAAARMLALKNLRPADGLKNDLVNLHDAHPEVLYQEVSEALKDLESLQEEMKATAMCETGSATSEPVEHQPRTRSAKSGIAHGALGPHGS
ncbi:hypothetical protein F5148DRAFT_1372121 [Russula earlei]|uniref:Uncharacterized protein n=1 Tax=Russula earlei TaxID=71964 RepID=A0ACC0TTE1_9AGAM|nr:hypothetical protein F5148DRAFT_1372121 [Russula earlei]